MQNKYKMKEFRNTKKNTVCREAHAVLKLSTIFCFDRMMLLIVIQIVNESDVQP